MRSALLPYHPNGVSASTNTVAALLNLAKNPTLNTPSLYNLISATPPFEPVLNTVPPDFAIRVTPPATAYPLQISPAALTFSGAGVGTTSPAQAVTIQNTGGSAISLSAITVTGTNPSDFSISNRA